jgi:hypothetical protein
MAGFEVIVRPVVFPNIRPAPTRSLPPADDPEQGQAVLSGGSGQVIALTHSFTAGGSRPDGTETERMFDVVRIKGEQNVDARFAGAGAFAALAASLAATGDDDAYIDVEVVTELKMRTSDGGQSVYNYTPIEESDNVTVLQRNVTRST